jgi:hypothetical protein
LVSWVPSYQHVRIDAVHYCELEIELSAKRKRRSYRDRAGQTVDIPQMRLLLFMRTVRASQRLGNMILSLRMPYMTREASKTELARTISVLPHLRYVDLPAGFYSDDMSSYALKQELMAKCPDIRRTIFAHGSEGSFLRIPGSALWPNLEVLELSDLHIEESTLRLVLASFPALRNLKLENLPSVGDSVFASIQSLPLFPPIQQLTLRNVPNVTASGLATYLSFPQNRDAVNHLVLSQTGILPQSLHIILAKASRLQQISIETNVDRSFPVSDIPLLASRSVTTLHYEITSTSSTYGIQPVSKSYYAYLMSSLLSYSLPALRNLYVLDGSFADTLLLAPPPRLYGGGEDGPRPSTARLRQPLAVYTKGMDELEWNYTQFEPTPSGRRASATRPISFHAAQLSPRWGGDARQSVVVGNGFGGFLAVPVDEGRPKSSGGYKRDSKYDLWR